VFLENVIVLFAFLENVMKYANKKYHSGWMWVGVTIGLASVKLSGSLNINGYCRLIIMNTIRRKINPYKSFNEK